MKYCELCRNNAGEESVCGACAESAKVLASAHAHYLEMGERFRKCCGGLATERDHFYFHGKYFDSTYPPKPKETDSYVTVEHGVSFYADHTRCYYLYDFDTDCGSTEYGETIPYDEPEFWKKLATEMDKAGEAAWNDDYLTCHQCGYHMGEEHSCDEDEE